MLLLLRAILQVRYRLRSRSRNFGTTFDFNFFIFILSEASSVCLIETVVSLHGRKHTRMILTGFKENTSAKLID